MASGQAQYTAIMVELRKLEQSSKDMGDEAVTAKREALVQQSQLMAQNAAIATSNRLGRSCIPQGSWLERMLVAIAVTNEMAPPSGR